MLCQELTNLLKNKVEPPLPHSRTFIPAAGQNNRRGDQLFILATYQIRRSRSSEISGVVDRAQVTCVEVKTRAGSLAVRRGFLTLTLPPSPTLSLTLSLTHSISYLSLFLSVILSLSLTLSLCHSIPLSHSFSLSLSLALSHSFSLTHFFSLTLSHAQTFSQLSPDDIWNNFPFDT